MILNNYPYPPSIMLQHFQSPFPLDSDQTIDRIICIGFRVVDPPCLETQEGRNMEGSIFQNFLSLILVHLSPKPTLIFKTGHIMFLPPSIQTLNVSITYLKIPMIEFFYLTIIEEDLSVFWM